MTTLAQQRAAIRAGVSNTRAATGADERRAIGKRIEAERRGESVVEDLNRLITPARQRRTLRSVPTVGSLPVTRGRGNYTPPAAGTGGGIASPLTEVETAEGSGVSLREYYEDVTVFYSTDYLMAVELQPLKQLHMTDANGDPVALKFQKPIAGGDA